MKAIFVLLFDRASADAEGIPAFCYYVSVGAGFEPDEVSYRLARFPRYQLMIPGSKEMKTTIMTTISMCWSMPGM